MKFPSGKLAAMIPTEAGVRIAEVTPNAAQRRMKVIAFGAKAVPKLTAKVAKAPIR